MVQRISPDDKHLKWYGCVSLERTKHGVKPWRIFREDRDLYYPMLMERAQKSSGVRLAFISNTTSLACDIVPWHEPTTIDICCDEELVNTVSLEEGAARFTVSGLPAKKKLVEIWWAPKGHTTLKSLKIDNGASLTPFIDRRPKWVTYGSSVTQCSGAFSPTLTWPAVAARNCGLNLTNLGMSGECVMDVMIARVMRDIPADFLSMCVGPNIYGYNGLNERTFRSSLLGFVEVVREKHPNAPFVLLSCIYYPTGDTIKNAAGFTMNEMRAEVKAAADTLRRHGDKNIHYVSGLEILGEEHANRLPDKSHPDGNGYKIMGENFTKKVARKYFVK